jgi:hypothetical protein
MAKNKTAAVSPKLMRRNTDILVAPLGESWRDAVTNMGISQKEAWKAKQAKDREERALINAKKRQGMLEENKAIEKKPASPKKEAGKKKSKTARIFPFKELPAEIRDLISKYALVKRNNKKPELLEALRPKPVLHKAALNIYYQINNFTLGLIEDSPLGPDIESSEHIKLMKNVKVHILYVDPFPPSQKQK